MNKNEFLVGDKVINTKYNLKGRVSKIESDVLLITYIATLLRYDVKITLLSCTFIPLAVFIAERLKKYILLATR